MTVDPIIPIWLMLILCVLFVLLILRSKNKYSFIRKTIVIVLLFMINLRIMIPLEGQVDLITNNLNVLLVIDTTISMVAEDYKGNTPRITAVKQDCQHIINTFKGSNFSIITFDNRAERVTPFTRDIRYTLEKIENLKIMDEAYSQGSSLNIAISETILSLESSSQKTDTANIIFFISDGEITNKSTLRSFAESKDLIENGAVLGYGTHQGGYMKVTDKLTEKTEYIQDTTQFPYKNALSKIDENNLKNVAQDMGIDYINMDKQSNLDYKITEIKQKILNNTRSLTKLVMEDIYYIFVIPLVLLLLYEMISLKRRFVL